MKNKFILGLILGIFLIGLVSAGITGYVLSRGQFVPGTSTQIGHINARTGTIAVDGTSVVVGETFTRSGKTFRVANVENPWLFGRAKVDIQEVAPSAKSGIGSSELLDVTEEECADNCQALTEVYKLDEGETLTINGDVISIDFINANQIKLDVNGQITPLLNEGNTFELSDKRIVIVKNVVKLGVAGEIGWVELGVGSYKLDEGEVINLQGNQISIDFINANQIKLDVNGQITPLLNEGNTFELSNGQLVAVEDVHRLEIAGEIGYVKLSLSSCYFPYL